MTIPRSLDDVRGLRAARWIRESTPGQFDRYGPAGQHEQIERFVERYELVDTGIAWEVPESGLTVWRHPTMAQMLDAARAGRFDLLLTGYADRWQRNLRRFLELIEDGLHPAGVALVMCDRRLLSSDPHDWDEMVSEAHQAERYSRRLSERIRDGIADKRRLRRDEWSHPTLGFRRGGPHAVLEPDPATMPSAVRAYQLAAAGRTDAAIAAELGLTVWRVRGALRSPLYAGRLRDGRPTTFPAPVDPGLWERAQAARRRRTWSGYHARHRTYALTGRGPLVCDACGAPLKGVPRRKPGGERRYYRHVEACPAWPSSEVRIEVLDDQVAQLLDGARPNRTSAARIRAALAGPPVGPDRLAVARLDGRLRQLALELVDANRRRDEAEVLAEIASLRSERDDVVARPVEHDLVPADEALDYLNDLGRLWRATDDEGRRRLALGLFARLGAVGVPRTLHDRRRPALARIVALEATEYAERRGLALALPTRLEVTLVGDTGVRPRPVTSWPVRIANRREWLAAARSA